ncbi:folylpolyglutamate synthase/dihydrofolate synthase family protein [Porticoccus sp. W117]|uniref:bifunctional folylpolyglutamate synthase/dihydrofolate synthase n=1 Tax=Porticoccus sp. W117 TaxID=3054777 RepID=UPI002597B67E|nr:folylpolyglutamate synthase/dihydrofolate synthase family protein [Porticoccus sp. W117]MDM3871672.1 folylpolyglutamate synthase/dihydrofolate synthase family protein [Porticoccus sp. W117]
MHKLNSLHDWLALLESRHPTEIDLGLDRIAEVYKRLGDTVLAGRALAERVVSVAGTNGKGSCVATLAALLQGNGLKVATYTSPHLLRFNERIAINDEPVSDAQLIDAFEKVEQARADVSLTYFEFTTLAAFVVMAQQPLDMAILEVGLGGRLDAVNIIDADISVVTSIDLDHQEYLGNTRESVATEKLGIARPDRPLLCGEMNLPGNFVAEAQQYGCRDLYLGKDFTLAPELVPNHLPYPSAACAVQAAQLLGVELTAEELAEQLPQVNLPGRFQRIAMGDRQLILDVAHNPAAAQLLAERLPKERQCQAVLAMMADKDLAEVIAPFGGLVEHWFLPPLVDNPRAAQPSELGQLLYNGGHSNTESSSVGSAIEQALAKAGAGGTVVVFGSFFTVAAALQWHRGDKQ